MSETFFSQFFFHSCVMKVEREGTYFFGVAGKLWRKIRRRRCGSCCFSSLLFVFWTLLILYMWCEEDKWWRECFVLIEDGRYKLWKYFLAGKVWSWFCTSTYREVFLLYFSEFCRKRHREEDWRKWREDWHAPGVHEVRYRRRRILHIRSESLSM